MRKRRSKLTIRQLQTKLAILAARIAAGIGSFLAVLAEIDLRSAWDSRSFATLAHWVAWRCNIDLRTSRDYVRVAQAIRDLPITAAALRAGKLTYSKARAITRAATPENEQALVKLASSRTAAQLDRMIAHWKPADPEGDRDRALLKERKRAVAMEFDQAGMFVMRARLSPEEGALVVRAMDAARDALWKDGKPPEDRPAAQQRADQLMFLADRSMAAGESPRLGSERVTVMVHVDQEVLANPLTDGQSRIGDQSAGSAEQCRRLACDAGIIQVTHQGDGGVLLSEKTPSISMALRRALSLRDHDLCTYPGCTSRAIEVHMLKHWANGGRPRLTNATSLCRDHHILVHEGGYRVKMTPAGVRFFMPDRRAIPAVWRSSRNESWKDLPAVNQSQPADNPLARVRASWVASVLGPRRRVSRQQSGRASTGGAAVPGG